jgi:hypothetical protein
LLRSTSRSTVVAEPRGPGDVGDYRHKAWIFDFDRGETGDGYTLDEGLASEVLLLGLLPTHDSAPDREPVQGRD